MRNRVCGGEDLASGEIQPPGFSTTGEVSPSAVANACTFAVVTSLVGVRTGPSAGVAGNSLDGPAVGLPALGPLSSLAAAFIPFARDPKLKGLGFVERELQAARANTLARMVNVIATLAVRPCFRIASGEVIVTNWLQTRRGNDLTRSQVPGFPRYGLHRNGRNNCPPVKEEFS